MYFDDHAVLHSYPGDPIQVVQVPKVRHRNVKIDVIGLIVHYAVTPNLEQTIAAQRSRTYWANASGDGYKDGQRVSQMHVAMQVPFNIQASHAKGFSNKYAGIEIAHPGPLILGKDGLLRTVWDRVWPKDDAIETGPVKGYPRLWTHWAKYTDEELGMLATLGLLMKERKDLFPNFREIAGHHEKDPKRKFDPGVTDLDVKLDGSPVDNYVFPMTWLRSVVFGGGGKDDQKAL